MADTLDVISLAEAKAALNIPSSVTENDLEIGVYVTAASRVLDARCGPVVNRTLTAELHDGGSYEIWLKNRPVYSVTSVTEYDYTTGTTLTAESNSVKPADGYYLDSNQGRILRRSEDTSVRFQPGKNNVAVTYVAGRAATTAAVDELFKRAGAMLVQHNWRRDRGQGTTAFGDLNEAYDPLLGAAYYLPRHVRDLLTPELLPPAVA